MTNASSFQTWGIYSEATIYAGLAQQRQRHSTADQYLTEAETAWKKYREMDPSMALVSDLAYQNGHINIYQHFFPPDADYTAKNWRPDMIN